MCILTSWIHNAITVGRNNVDEYNNRAKRLQFYCAMEARYKLKKRFIPYQFIKRQNVQILVYFMLQLFHWELGLSNYSNLFWSWPKLSHPMKLMFHCRRRNSFAVAWLTSRSRLLLAENAQIELRDLQCTGNRNLFRIWAELNNECLKTQICCHSIWEPL